MVAGLDRSAEQQDGPPSVVLSFDFEMRWAFHDIHGLDWNGYRANLENCRPAVLSMLRLLEERNLRATWATVGALGATGWDDYFSFAPPPPAYLNPKLAVRKEYADMDPDGTLHFAPDLIRQIAQTDGQELGSHSFSHLYFREPGVTAEDFLADMAAVELLWKVRFNVKPTSLVYPRNQTAFSELIEKTSITLFRGPEPAWFYDCTSQRRNRKFPRVLRLLDSLNPWITRAAPLEGKMIRASLFVRFDLPEWLWQLQLKRIRNELNDLESGHIFHCWWHPHNVGVDLAKGIARFSQVFDLISNACSTGRVKSQNMRDLVC